MPLFFLALNLSSIETLSSTLSIIGSSTIGSAMDLSSGSADTVLKNLITCFVNGSNSGLAALIDKIGGSNSLVKALLNSLLSGITGSAPGGATSPVGTPGGKLVNGLMSSLFAKWGV